MRFDGNVSEDGDDGALYDLDATTSTSDLTIEDRDSLRKLLVENDAGHSADALGRSGLRAAPAREPCPILES